MGISDIPIFSMLRTRMQWHQDRQRVLADNVANTNTPGFRPRDLVEPKFDGLMSLAPAGLMRTNSSHLAGAEGQSVFASTSSGFQVRLGGNAVSLEDEMLKVASNQMDFQAATSLYNKSLGLIKIAVGKK